MAHNAHRRVGTVRCQHSGAERAMAAYRLGQQDWIAIGGSVAGGLILFAGIGSLITERYRLYRLRQRAHPALAGFIT